MKKNRGAEKKEWVTAVRAVLIGAFSGALILFLLMVLSAYLISCMNHFPQQAVYAVVLFLSGLGSLCSGFVTARTPGKRGLPLGSASGLLLFLLFAAAGFSVGSILSFAVFFTRMAVMVLSGALGGYAGIRKK